VAKAGEKRRPGHVQGERIGTKDGIFPENLFFIGSYIVYVKVDDKKRPFTFVAAQLN
jgi:hypothetical protein